MEFKLQQRALIGRVGDIEAHTLETPAVLFVVPTRNMTMGRASTTEMGKLKTSLKLHSYTSAYVVLTKAGAFLWLKILFGPKEFPTTFSKPCVYMLSSLAAPIRLSLR